MTSTKLRMVQKQPTSKKTISMTNKFPMLLKWLSWKKWQLLDRAILTKASKLC